MKIDQELELAVYRSLDEAAMAAEAAREAHDTDAMKDAIRIARNRLVEAYDALNQAEQAARAKYWKISA